MMNSDGNRTTWRFLDGSISVSASILLANAVSKCESCSGLPVIGLIKQLTEQDDGVLIAGTALLFPVAVILYGGINMVFMAYAEYRRKRDARIREREALLEKARNEGRDEFREEVLERARQVLREHNVSLTPEVERFLSDAGNSRSSKG